MWTGDLKMLEHPSPLAFLGSSVIFLAAAWTGEEACEKWDVCLETGLHVPMGPDCVFLWTLGAEVLGSASLWLLAEGHTDNAGPPPPGLRPCL